MPRYRLGREEFINPYNFIPVENRKPERNNYMNLRRDPRNLLTGWINCRLKTLTPTFIPNTSGGDDLFEKRDIKNQVIKSYDFYSYKNLEGVTNPDPEEPVIPGSEIRGMTRSAYEALTNSCLSTIDDEQKLYKRTTVPGKGCGRLYKDKKDNKWYIQECEKVGISFKSTRSDPRNFSGFMSNLKEGKKVYVKTDSKVKYITRRGHKIYKVVIDIKRSPTTGYRLGYFHKGEPFGNRKHHESIFIPKGNKHTMDIEEEAVENLLENFKIYRDNTVNIHKRKGEHSGYEHIKPGKISDLNGALVYYTKHNNKYYLSPSAIGREVFYTKLTNIIGEYKPCFNINEFCPACILFCTAGRKDKDCKKKIEDAAVSRVRFTDAKITEESKKEKKEDYYHDVTILPELASPKPSCTEFYLERPAQADIWNYDYAIRWERRRDGRLTNKSIDIRNYFPKIHGRKFYWHKKITAPPQEIRNDEEGKPSDRNVAVRALKKDNTFEFKVYFNDITENELKKIIWTLEIGGKTANAHKIGMGKPLGLGSVKVEVSGVTIRKIQINDNDLRYETVSRNDYIEASRNLSSPHELLGCSPDTVEKFLKITDYENAPVPVEYPNNENDGGESYKWFMANKQAGIGTGISHVIEQCLPVIGEPKLTKYKSF